MTAAPPSSPPTVARLAVLSAQQELAPALALEADHAVYHRTIVDWDASPSLDQLRVDLGCGWMTLTLPELLEAKRYRAQLLADEKADPLRHAWECEQWKRTDLRMARKRLEHPGVVLELLATGGIRGTKTFGAGRRVMANFLYTENAKIWVLDETEPTSKRWHQAQIYRLLPPELDPTTGRLKKDKSTKFNYSEGSGFTDNFFNIHWDCYLEDGRQITGGGLWEHRFYGSDIATLQGAELTCANSDELVPKAVCDSVRERLLSRAQDTSTPAFLARIRKAVALLEAGLPVPLPLLGAIYHSVHIITFTPKEGYSSTVADFLDGALTVDITDTKILPDGVGLHTLPAEFVAKYSPKNPE